jgi:DNA repair exonuclease SbcCD ATPase subunit
MSIEMLTYAALGGRLNISSQAARSLTRRLRLPRSLSDDGKALVSVDLAEIRHTPRPRRGRASSSALLEIEALKAEIARLETTAADHRADFERERERADRLAVELLQATAETTAAQEVTARLEALKAEIARLEARAADNRADFERECERAARLVVELQQATAETMAAKEVTARLEDEVAALRAGGSVDSHGQAARRLGHLAASIVEADRKSCR